MILVGKNLGSSHHVSVVSAWLHCMCMYYAFIMIAVAPITRRLSCTYLTLIAYGWEERI